MARRESNRTLALHSPTVSGLFAVMLQKLGMLVRPAPIAEPGTAHRPAKGNAPKLQFHFLPRLAVRPLSVRTGLFHLQASPDPSSATPDSAALPALYAYSVFKRIAKLALDDWLTLRFGFASSSVQPKLRHQPSIAVFFGCEVLHDPFHQSFYSRITRACDILQSRQAHRRNVA